MTPGHVFPLVAREGGVLVRAGHTEAAVDVSRLAGLNPSGVICEIMNEDGTMSRLDDLVSFAQLHNLKIGTIRDLIAYRRRHDHLVQKRAEMVFHSKWGGDWKAMTFFNKATGDEQIALVKGKNRSRHPDPRPHAQPVDVRRRVRRGIGARRPAVLFDGSDRSGGRRRDRRHQSPDEGFDDSDHDVCGPKARRSAPPRRQSCAITASARRSWPSSACRT